MSSTVEGPPKAEEGSNFGPGFAKNLFVYRNRLFPNEGNNGVDYQEWLCILYAHYDFFMVPWLPVMGGCVYSE
jgi:hypothetical protein